MASRTVISLTVFLCLTSASHAQSSGDESWSNLYPDLFELNDSIARGTVLSISVHKVPKLNGQHVVDEEGYVELPLIGKVIAIGHTLNSFADELEVLYEKDYLVNPSIAVSQAVASLPPTARIIEDVDKSATGVETTALLDEQTEVVQTFETSENESSLEFDSSVEETFVSNESSPVIDDKPYETSITQPSLEFSQLGSDTYQSNNAFFLAGTDWLVAGDQQGTVNFLIGGGVAGKIGCSDFFAAYVENNGTIAISDLSFSHLNCDEIREISEFYQVFSLAQSYLTSQDALILFNEQGDVIITLVKAQF